MVWVVKYRDTNGTVKTSAIFFKKNSAEVWVLHLKGQKEIVECWIEEVSD